LTGEIQITIHDHQKIHWVDPELPRRAAQLTTRLEGERQPGETEQTLQIAIVLFDDEQMIRIHKQYLDIDETTDVLAFNLDDDFEVSHDESEVSRGALLGDVFVNVEQAQRQAEEYQHSLGRELAILVSHGVLHLLGYDDADQRGRDEMMRKSLLIADHEWLSSYTNNNDEE